MANPAAAAGRSTFRQRSLWLLLPLAARALVYFNALHGAFVYDDTDQILKNPWVQDARYLRPFPPPRLGANKTPKPTNYSRRCRCASTTSSGTSRVPTRSLSIWSA